MSQDETVYLSPCTLKSKITFMRLKYVLNMLKINLELLIGL